MTETPFIIAVAPNGARKTKADHPNLAITPAELASEAARCAEAGATLLHLHVRDSTERHTIDPDAYRAAIAAIRAETGDRLILQVTTEAVGRYAAAEQIAAMQALAPEAVSLAIRELVPDAAHEPQAARFFAWLARERILVQYILYTPEEIARFHDLRRRGVVPGERVCVLYALGRYAARGVAEPADLLPYLAARGEADESIWFICAFGPSEGAAALAAAALGGHARVGFENNTILANGAVAPSTAALAAQLRDAAPLAGRRVADVAAARALLGSRG